MAKFDTSAFLPNSLRGSIATSRGVGGASLKVWLKRRGESTSAVGRFPLPLEYVRIWLARLGEVALVEGVDKSWLS